uniref:Uncharacterized protein n=1 Tax=Anopheles quadriannulatus TaxID=34691 RepID=A0A182WTI8_ANOQN
MEQEINQIISFLRRPLKSLGFDVIDPNWKVTPLTMFTIVMFALQHYTSYLYLSTHLDMFDMFTECFSTSAVALEIAIRMCLLVHQRELRNETIEIIRQQQKVTARFHKLISVTLHALAACYMSTMMFELIPIVSPNPRKSNLPLPMYLPYMPHDVTPYWHLNYTFITVMNFMCILFLVGIDGLLVLSILAAVHQIKLLKITIQELDIGAEQAELHRELVRIIQIHQRIQQFIHQLEQTYYIDLLVDFGLVCLILCMGLNVIADEVINAIWFFLIAVVFQLSLLCFSGNLLLIESDSLSSCVYSIDWHAMPVPEQKLLMVMIAHAQKPQVLRGIFMPLIMSSFLSVIKASYSYFTLLH